MKRIVVLSFLLFSVFLCSSLFAEKANLTISAVSDIRLKTWVSKDGSISDYNNDGLVKTGFGPAIGCFYNFNKNFETGIESKLFVREAQNSRLYLQFFTNVIARWKQPCNEVCSIFLDFGMGPVVSYLGGNYTSFGLGLELGCGLRWSIKNNKYITIKTNLVGVSERYKNASASSGASVFVLSAQPISFGFSWKY